MSERSRQGMESDNSNRIRKAMMQAALEQKDYYVHAWATFMLYFLGWLPGLIFNLLVLSRARKDGRIIGKGMSGVGCLWLLLIMNVVIPALIILFVTSGATIMNMLNNRPTF